MKAVIMAGGKGTRLRPLTCDLPKPMVPIVNYPVIEYIIKLLKEIGITEIAITSYYIPQIIEDHFEDGENWGVNIHYYIEEEPLGTAGSVHNADDFLDETFLVISGDAITDFDLKKAINFHREQNSEATLVLTREEIPLEYGVVMTDNSGRIIRFLEKPNWGQVFSDKVNTGIYILEPEIFNMYDKGVKFDFSKDLFPLMLEMEKRLYGITLQGYWNDIGNLAEYHKTQFDLLNGKINLPINADLLIDDNIWVEEGVEIDESANLEGPVYLGRGTKVGKGVYLSNSVIGKNTIIKPYASIKNSILWDNNYIGRHAEIRGTVIANNSTIHERSAIFDKTAIGKKVIIGKGSRVKPDVKIWPEREIDNKTIVERSIVWEPQWSRNLFSNNKIAGHSNIELTPEFVSRLALAYGSTLKGSKEVIISSDSYKISNALKRSFASGLQAAGIDVVDIGDTITAVTRYSVSTIGAQAGVHFRISYKDREKSVIEFIDDQGVIISTDKQKTIEKKYFAEDYNRAPVNDVGKYTYAPEMNRNYVEAVLKGLNTEEIKRNYFSIVVDYEYDNLANILPLFLKRLNCQTLSTRNFSRDNLPLSLKERLEISDRVGRIMRENQSDIGVIVDHNGESLNLVNFNGEVISSTQYQVLISYLLLEKGLKKLYLPLNAPEVIKNLAENYGAEVEYTPVSIQNSMEKHYNAQNQGNRVFNFYPFTDAIAGLGLILEKMAAENLNFNQLMNRLPEFYLNNAEISCTWKDKGRVMRHLSEEADTRTELIDGIKFFHPQGWALVLPDSERPVFHIFAEGQDQETAESLTGFYLDKVKELINREG